ncbi:MAG: hypothetical protein EPN93_07440 [Spirochaetes bacterium]|nr:MAG: hypothetical protein EPN93_07440 [Spirochaetota bacterium]
MKRHTITRALLPLVIACASTLVSCFDAVKLNESGDARYRFVLYNRTEGYLKSARIDTTVCGAMAPNQSCTAAYEYRPLDVEVSYESETVAAVSEGVSKTLTVTTTDGIEEDVYNLALPDTHFSLWVTNYHTSREINMVGMNYTANSGITLDDFAKKTALINFQGEDLTHTGPTVSDTLLHTGIVAGSTSVYAQVKGTGFSVTAAAESLSVTGTDVSDTLANAHIVEGSLVVYVDGIQVAATDAGGTITGSGLASNGTLDYETGAIAFSLSAAPLTGVTCDYRYTDTTGVVIAKRGNGIRGGSLVIRVNGTEIGRDNGSGSISGTGIDSAQAHTINYASGAITFTVKDPLDGSAVTCDYLAKIGGTDAVGVISGTGIEGTGTIDYGTGAIALVTTAEYDPGTGEMIIDYRAPFAKAWTGGTWGDATGVSGETLSFSGTAVSDTLLHVEGLMANNDALTVYAGVPGEILANTAETVSDTLVRAPRTGSIVVRVAGQTVGTDDGAGNISGTGISGTGTVNYSTREINLTLTANPGTDTVTCDYLFAAGTAAAPVDGYRNISGAGISGTGKLNCITGAISLTLAADPGTPGVLVEYSYRVPVIPPERCWIGFYEIGGISSAYALDLDVPGSAVEHYFMLADYPEVKSEFAATRYGTKILDLVCGANNVHP